jgi:glyceraldehyde 3-phosphate dehydrogenase
MQSTYNPAELNWEGIDVLLECTGVHNSKEASIIHLENGAKKVLLSAPGKNVDKTVVYGVNHKELRPDDLIVSNASCTTNCLAPIAKVLNDAIGIENGIMTTIHSYTGDQPTLDKKHSDLYRSRAAAMSMIPTSTGAAKAVSLVLPELSGKLDGSAIRVPTPNVSCVDLTFQASKDTNIKEVNLAIKNIAETSMKGVLDYDPEPKVSIDFNHDTHSSNFAPAQTKVLNNRLVRVLSWYDNEWGFSCRMADTAVTMGKLL